MRSIYYFCAPKVPHAFADSFSKQRKNDPTHIFRGGWQSLYTRIRTLRGSHPPDAYIYFNRHIISQQSIMATLPNYILGDKLPQPAGGKLCAGGVLLPFLTYSTSGIIITKYIPHVE